MAVKKQKRRPAKIKLKRRKKISARAAVKAVIPAVPAPGTPPATAGDTTQFIQREVSRYDADTAIKEFEKTLTYAPGHANTLFNLGVVRWQGKMDPKGAVEDWETLLKLNPNYDNKARVLELISRARQHMSGTPGGPKG